MAVQDRLLSKPEELVGRLAICEATAEVISCSAVVILTAVVGIASVRIEYSTHPDHHS